MAEEGNQLLEQLMRFKPEGLTPNAWAVQAGVGRTIWADLRRHGNPSRRTLSKLLEAAGSSLAEFEALRVGTPSHMLAEDVGLAERGQAWRAAPLAPLPLREARLGEPWDGSDIPIELIEIDQEKLIDRVPRPPSLAAERGAYAMTIVGESMWPRFRKGRRIAVSPDARVRAGDDVLVLLTGGKGTLIGELERQTATAAGLRQFNPPAGFEVPAASVQAIHKVLGELI